MCTVVYCVLFDNLHIILSTCHRNFSVCRLGLVDSRCIVAALATLRFDEKLIIIDGVLIRFNVNLAQAFFFGPPCCILYIAL